MLLSQVLRLFLAEHGYTLYYAAKYDCRLTASATLEGENINGVLRTFLHSFSLSAKINNNNNVVNVLPPIHRRIYVYRLANEIFYRKIIFIRVKSDESSVFSQFFNCRLNVVARMLVARRSAG